MKSSEPRPLLMIPGPVEISPAVHAALQARPPSHLAPDLIDAFGQALSLMRQVWRAGADAQPFVLAGGGTAAMDAAVANLIEPGDAAVVVNTGYFSDRMAEMIRRAGARVAEVKAAVGDAPEAGAVREALRAAATAGPVKALFATHVDTSTGVRIDPAPLCRLASEQGALSVVDGVCATGGEAFEMEAWGGDVYLTASQKALGLPPGLALLVASPRAMEARARRRAMAPPMYLDWNEWLPIMKAYEERRGSYFSTPATGLLLALPVALQEILADGIAARVALHARAAAAMRAAWRALGLSEVPRREPLRASTLSALFFPDGVDASLVGRIREHGALVAGGLHPEIRTRYFRVGHMGYAVTQPDMLVRTVRAVGSALRDAGRPVDVDRACAEARAALA